VQTSKILLTKITPPPRSSRTLLRNRILRVLEEAMDYRLTIVQAGAGYGKSTALIDLAEKIRPLIWYQMSDDDNDPLIFLLHLIQATQRVFPQLKGLPIPLLETWDGSQGPLPCEQVVDQYLNVLSDGVHESTLVVLDDLHYLTWTEITCILDRLIAHVASNLHFLIATRPPLKLPNLARWRAHGEVLNVEQSVLAFTPDEINTLFSEHFNYELTNDEAESLYSSTEGWPVAIQLIWQSLRSGASASIEDALDWQAASLDSLFEILAGEVFEGLPDDVKDFLLKTSVLRMLQPDACDALRRSQYTNVGANGAPEFVSSTAMLSYLRNHDLFIVDQGNLDSSMRASRTRNEMSFNFDAPLRIRYHNIFQNFLQQQAAPEELCLFHKRAGEYYLSQQNLEEAIYHYLQAQDTKKTAELLDPYGATLLSLGRHDTLAIFLDRLPPETLQQHPNLLYYLGEIARLHSRFNEALGWYQQAEVMWRERNQRQGIGRALRGQARIYLDTVNPSRAEELLQQALRMSDGLDDRQSQARLYELLAENKLNAGHVEEAERLSKQAESLLTEGPSDTQLKIRVMLRTGQLHQAQLRLEEQAEAELLEPVATPRAHRETQLLLSLIYSFQGLPEPAYQCALDGTRRGIDLNSPFVTAVGYMRQGHALMLLNHDKYFSQAIHQFEKAIEISQTLSVPRLEVEASWGLCRAYGYQGDIAQAFQFAEEGIHIATQAGDEWIASLIRLTLGSSLILAARYETAYEWLNRAILGFKDSSDPFGNCVARLWSCLGLFRQKNWGRLNQALPETLAAAREGGYDFLFTRPTLLGAPDERYLIPMTILARDQTHEHSYASRLLFDLGLSDISTHPGYLLRVSALGTFQVFRGNQSISSKGWRRDKARQLFQILLTYRDYPVDRDQFLEYLWPQLDPNTSQRNFKVTLNTLYNVLEPDRKPGCESAYIVRSGTTYKLRPGADIWIDVQEFFDLILRGENLILTQPDLALLELEKANRLYRGEYLPDARYETWAAAERERLSTLFLRASDQLADLYVQKGMCTETIDLCTRILAIDNCWERAYRYMMLAFHNLGDQGQVARTYHRCVQILRDELDVGPALETNKLYKQLTQQEPDF
jgi:LuxR family transcriptional regulator, maltose regulon positive regulatory protein